MVRSIVAVIASYIAMVMVVIGSFMGLWYGLGPDGLLEPGSFKGNWTICIAAPGITVVAGLLGGWLCAKIAGVGTAGRSGKPVMVLAGIVLVLGLTMAFFTLQKPYPADPRPAGMTVEQIMEVGREPA